MKAMPAAGGTRQAVYEWKEAVGITEELVAEQILQERRAEYDDAVAGLLMALDAAGERQYRQAIEGLLDAPDLEAFTRITESMAIVFRATGQTEWADAVDRIVEARTAPLSYSELSREVDRRMAELTSGVSYRHDTSSELAALLRIDPTAPPRLQDLKHLFSARTAEGKQIEGRFYRTDRPDQMTMGSLGLIFSADKSVSAVYALASSEERQEIVDAQRAAVDAAMREIAARAGFIRSRRGGLDRRDPADVTWVQSQHRLSRRGDPQLHTHVSLLNVVRSRVDGKVGTLDTYLLNGHYHKIRETYHRALAHELGLLGLQVHYDDRVPAAVLTEVPKIVQRHFSSRTVDAEAAAVKWLQENTSGSFADLTPKQRSTWLTQMSAKTRPPPPNPASPANNPDEWRARAAGQGYAPPQRFIDNEARAGRSGPPLPPQRFIDRTDRGVPPPSQARNTKQAPWRFAYDEMAYKQGRSL